MQGQHPTQVKEGRNVKRESSMNIKGKVHCFFEQSGTFKNEFIKLGYEAEDYDIQNQFGETDNIIDLFKEIEKCYDDGERSLFDKISKDDLILAFFPCIHFCDAKTLMFKGEHISQKKWSIAKKMEYNIQQALERSKYFDILLKLVYVCATYNLRLIIENPYNPSGMTYLENNFLSPTIIDRNRMLRGDYYVKPTAYWFFNCSPTYGRSFQKDKMQKIIMKAKGSGQTGVCSSERSMISPDYARNFICDFIIGKEQKYTERLLF